ncbi:MAG: septal ring lytic transglycosylase RlpA family protein [Saprospiraceae bacterium]|nr:septal ring lytic transglycosylase RlpA family protein [Saprospiraceae bacterium]
MKFLSFFIFFCLHVTLFSQEYGLASYYADSFHGNATANGELYDRTKLTAAHSSLPFGTMVKVTRLDNNKSVIVKINDRGPFTKGRVIDISKAAAAAIDLIVAGEARVRLDVVGQGKSNVPTPSTDLQAKGSTTTAEKVTPKTTTTPIPSTYSDKSISKSETTAVTKTTNTKPVSTTKPAAAKVTPKKTTTTKSTSATESIGAPKLVRGDFENAGLYKIQLLRPDKKGFGVQVASYANYENALERVSDLQGKWFDDILINIASVKNNTTYQVILGQFPTEASAINYQKSLKTKYKINGFIVNLSEL